MCNFLQILSTFLAETFYYLFANTRKKNFNYFPAFHISLIMRDEAACHWSIFCEHLAKIAVTFSRAFLGAATSYELYVTDLESLNSPLRSLCCCLPFASWETDTRKSCKVHR